MLERITALKKFVLSKFWYQANFFVIKNQEIKIIQKIIFNFIRNNNREFILAKFFV